MRAAGRSVSRAASACVSAAFAASSRFWASTTFPATGARSARREPIEACEGRRDRRQPRLERAQRLAQLRDHLGGVALEVAEGLEAGHLLVHQRLGAPAATDDLAEHPLLGRLVLGDRIIELLADRERGGELSCSVVDRGPERLHLGRGELRLDEPELVARVAQRVVGLDQEPVRLGGELSGLLVALLGRPAVGAAALPPRVDEPQTDGEQDDPDDRADAATGAAGGRRAAAAGAGGRGSRAGRRHGVPPAAVARPPAAASIAPTKSPSASCGSIWLEMIVSTSLSVISSRPSLEPQRVGAVVHRDDHEHVVGAERVPVGDLVGVVRDRQRARRVGEQDPQVDGLGRAQVDDRLRGLRLLGRREGVGQVGDRAVEAREVLRGRNARRERTRDRGEHDQRARAARRGGRGGPAPPARDAWARVEPTRSGSRRRVTDDAFWGPIRHNGVQPAAPTIAAVMDVRTLGRTWDDGRGGLPLADPRALQHRHRHRRSAARPRRRPDPRGRGRRHPRVHLRRRAGGLRAAGERAAGPRPGRRATGSRSCCRRCPRPRWRTWPPTGPGSSRCRCSCCSARTPSSTGCVIRERPRS